MQLALDTTLVSPVRVDGTARPGAAQRDGVALVSPRRLKERTYPGAGGTRRQCSPGCWSGETSTFLRLAEAKARPSHLFSGGEWSVRGRQVGCDPGEDARLRPIRLRPAGRNRIWPKSNRWCLLFIFFYLLLLFLFFLIFVFLFVPKHFNPKHLNPDT